MGATIRRTPNYQPVVYQLPRTQRVPATLCAIISRDGTISIFDGYNIPLVIFIKQCRQIQRFISRSEEPEVAHMKKDRLRGRTRAVHSPE